MAKTNKKSVTGYSDNSRFKSFGGRIALVEGWEPKPVLDEETAARLDLVGQTHPNKQDKIRARKRYVTASAEGKAGIDEALHQRRLRRLKALWDPDFDAEINEPQDGFFG